VLHWLLDDLTRDLGIWQREAAQSVWLQAY
jgi:hypothetical protein